MALLKERSGKQSNIAVATGRDVKDEQKKEESVTKKPFVETAVYKSKDGGLDYGQNPYEGREGAKGSHIAKQKESGQHQIELSDDSKSTSALANKSENDCDQQYGKPLKRTVLDDGYVEAIYEKKNTTINIIFNKDGCIDCISYLSNEPFTEEQRKVLIENYSINKEEWSHSPMASLYLFPKPIKDGSRTDFAINQLVSNMIRMPSTPYGVWVRSDNGDFMGMWGRGDGAEAFYYKKAGYILKIQSKNYAEWVQKEKEKSGNKEKQVERSRVDGL